MSLKLCFLFTLALSFSVGDETFYRKDYKYVPSENAHYKIHRSKSTFSEAISLCTKEDSQLLIPSSMSEIESVFGTATLNLSNIWIGVHDLYSEGEFVTLNGEEIESVYHKWRRGEPNNHRGNEDCVLVFKDGTYNDVNCDNRYHFACKKLARDLVHHKPCETFDPGFKYDTGLNRCYKLETKVANWTEAFKECKVRDSNLAIINSAEEAQYLKNELVKINGDEMEADRAFLGFSDLLDIGVFKTIDGKNLSQSGFLKWSKGEPRHRGKNYCGAILRDGLLGVMDCTKKAVYFCEKALPFTLDVRFD